MNTNSYQQPEMGINLKEIIWDLLEQWKAMLITALLMALLIAGAKYYKDTNVYKASLRARETATQSGKTSEERIADIIANLPEDEVSTVEFMINQNEWIETEKEYMNNSILMNTNPANQRTLLLDYYISMSDPTESKMTALAYGYAGYLNDENLVKSLGQIIAPDAETKYIAELISTRDDKKGSGIVIDSDADGAVVEICIVLPVDADSEMVENAMTNALSGYTSDLRSKIGDHSIRLIKASESYIYNIEAVNNHNNIMGNIYGLQVNEKNMMQSLSDGQKAAIESIKAIKKESNGSMGSEKQALNVEDNELIKPGISKKYALLGFILGAIAYGFVYLVLLILRRRVNYASDVEGYTHARLIGEIYQPTEHKGFGSLFHSNLVSKYRYGDKTDTDAQIVKAIDALGATCEHAGVKEATLFNIGGSTGHSTIVDQLVKMAHDQGIELKPKEITDEIDEKSLLPVDNALFMTGSETRVADVVNMTGLCSEYDVNVLGNIYTQAI